jgi:hypothetical protein
MFLSAQLASAAAGIKIKPIFRLVIPADPSHK